MFVLIFIYFDMTNATHKAGFVSIVGKPNVGKSTLMNALVGQKLSIVTSKAQTTRHRVMGILNGDDFQIVYSDTPGILEPMYMLHQRMMKFVYASLEDADLILYLVEPEEPINEELLVQLKKRDVPVFLIITKMDLFSEEVVKKEVETVEQKNLFSNVMAVSARDGVHIPDLLSTLIGLLPLHPPYYPKEDISSQSERFFAAEIIREKLFLIYAEEVPYCCQVEVTSFKEEDKIIRIAAEIYVERESQKAIVIGKKGENMKKLGIAARKDLEQFFQKKIFLEQFVKVEKDWRRNEKKLDRFGY